MNVRVQRAHHPRVYLAASVGGHLELLEALSSALDGRPRAWVTTPGSRPRALVERGEDVRLLSALDRKSFSLGRLLEGVRLAVRLRPRVLITSGAGVVASFCLTARLLGAKMLFVETMARVQRGSATGRMLAPFADRVLIQWPELRRQYGSAIVCAPLLLERVPPIGGGTGAGTFVSVGSHPKPFWRLLTAVRHAFADDVLPLPAYAQVGAGELVAPDVESTRSIRPKAFSEAVATHRVIICHGGAGVIASVLRQGKRPMVMARKGALGEHVDDHQSELLSKLTELGLAVRLDDRITPDHVARSLRPEATPTRTFASFPSVTDEVTRWLQRVAQ